MIWPTCRLLLRRIPSATAARFTRRVRGSRGKSRCSWAIKLANPLSCGLIMLASVVRDVLCAATIVANPRYGGYFLLNSSKFYCPLVRGKTQYVLNLAHVTRGALSEFKDTFQFYSVKHAQRLERGKLCSLKVRQTPCRSGRGERACGHPPPFSP